MPGLGPAGNDPSPEIIRQPSADLCSFSFWGPRPRAAKANAGDGERLPVLPRFARCLGAVGRIVVSLKFERVDGSRAASKFVLCLTQSTGENAWSQWTYWRTRGDISPTQSDS